MNYICIHFFAVGKIPCSWKIKLKYKNISKAVGAQQQTIINEFCLFEIRSTSTLQKHDVKEEITKFTTNFTPNASQLDEYLTSNYYMNKSRTGEIYSDIVNYELLTYCIVHDELLALPDCSSTFTVQEQELIAKYYQNMRDNFQDIETDFHTKNVVEVQLKKLLVKIPCSWKNKTQI